MFKKIISISLTALILCFIFTSCGDSIAGVDAQMIMPIDSDPGYLDPQICSSTASLNIINNCFEGLVDVDADGEIVAACAESYEVSADGLTYTFYLRDDLQWRMTTSATALMSNDDGELEFDTQITAYDFAFALERAVSSETLAPFVSSLFSIKNAEEIYNGEKSVSKLGVTVISDLVLEIELETPDLDFLYTLSTSIAMPCSEEFFEATGGRYGLSTTYLIYNGAFYISSWSDDTSITATKNTLYYDYDSVMPSSIYYSINDEYDTRSTKVISGTYEVSPILESQVSSIEADKKSSLVSFESSTFSMFFNCEDTLLGNPSLRQALVYSLDMDVINSEIDATEASGILPSTTMVTSLYYEDLRGDLEFLDYDTTLSSTLYKEVLDTLDSYSLELTILCSQENESMVRQLIQSWQSAMGISLGLSVEAVDSTTLASQIESGDYQIAFADVNFTGSTAYNALSMFLTDSSENVFNYDSNDFNDLMSEVKSSSSFSQMASYLTEAENLLLEDAVIVPLFEQEIYYGLADGVSGVYFNSTGEIVTFKYALRA